MAVNKLLCVNDNSSYITYFAGVETR